MNHPIARRSLLASAAGIALSPLSPLAPRAWADERRFEPQPGAWRRFELTTTVELRNTQGPARVWVPLPSVDSNFQRVLDDSFGGNAGNARVVSDLRYGARMLAADFAEGVAPQLQVSSQFETQNRATDWTAKTTAAAEDRETLRFWLRPTELIPTDGIVRETAQKIVKGERDEVAKARAIYDWVVANTYREPKVRGCGIGDIKSMLETGNLGGKCADLNALFVGLCRSAGLPARDLYGIRLAPSAFGYKELGGNPASLKGAQHCRAEVYLSAHGWTAMDPADVAKVMRQETAEWIKDARHPLVAPVNKTLFGGWEGNWLAYNMAHDVSLPGSRGQRIGFLMYPQAETAEGRIDSLTPDDFRYQISAREIARA